MNKPDKLIKSMLGNDFFDILKKSDVYKMYSKTVTGIDEVSTGLKIVPRTIMSFLISNLSHIETNGYKDLELPFAPDCHLQITKIDNDVFSGYIYSKGKKINEFQNRSIPGIGLVLMTTFELYDIDQLKNTQEKEQEIFDVSKLQQIIDDRLRLHSLVRRVVDQQLAQRDAVEILVKEKLEEALFDRQKKDEEDEEEVVDEKPKKSERLKRFLEERKKKEFFIQKTENINCPDCGSNLYDGGKNLTLCICYGSDWNKNIKIKKNENNIRLDLSKNIDSENADMLMQTLKFLNKKE